MSSNKVLAERETTAGLHMVLSGRYGRHRLLIAQQSDTLSYVLPADAALDVRLAAASAFHGTMAGRQCRSPHALLGPSRHQRYRLGLLLAILDRFDRPGQTPTVRTLAEDVIFPGLDCGPAIAWKTSSHRRQAQRLLAEAHRMARYGFREMLAHRPYRDATLPHREAAQS